MRLIDADALMKNWERDRGRMFDADYFIFTIEHAPTIDALPVIRCKDCVHYRVYQLASDGETITDCAVMPCHPTGNWYCSNAERKDDE